MKLQTRILVVDDEPTILNVYSSILREEGYQVWEEQTGEGALASVRANRPNLVVLDVNLPDLSGIEVCRRIKAAEDLQDIFVILFSGMAITPEHKAGGLEIGADEYLVKPVAMPEFLARIRTVERLQRTTAALRASQEHYRRLLDILPDAVGSVNLEGRLTSVNRQAVLTMGYADAAELMAKSAFELTPAAEHERLMLHMETLLEAGIVQNQEYSVLRKNGEAFPVEVSAALLRDNEGGAPQLVGVVRDISQRKRSEARIRQLLDLLDQAQDSILILDLEDRVEYFSKGAERLLGWRAEEVRGKPIAEIFSPDSSTLEAALCALRKTGSWSGELHLLTREKTSRIVDSRWTRVQTGEDRSSYTVLISTDITERKKTEVLLRQKEELSQRILTTAMDGFWAVDLDGRLLDVNDAYCRLSGYSREELLSMHISDLEANEPSTDLVAAHIKRIVQRGGDRFETRHRHKDGRLLDVDVSVTSLLVGAPRIFVFIRDISERSRADRLLQTQRDFGVFLSSTDSLEQALSRLLALALENEGVDCGSVFRLDRKTGALVLASHRGLSPGLAKRVSRLEKGSDEWRVLAAKQVSSWRRNEKARRAESHLEAWWAREGLEASVTVPILHGEQTVAVLCAGSHARAGGIPVNSRLAVEAIAAQAGAALARLTVEEALTESRQRLEKTLNSLRSAVLIVDVETKVIQECNSTATRMFGFSREELIGKTTDFLRLEDGGALPRRARPGSKPAELIEFQSRMRRKDGAWFPTEHSVMPIRNEAGRVVGLVNVVRDITERKRVEDELRRLSQHIIDAQESERLRVARELHDGVNQIIASAKMRLRKVTQLVSELSPAGKEILARSEQLLVEAVEENRRIAHNLRPSDLDEFGLFHACRNLCEQFHGRTDLRVQCSLPRSKRRLPASVELNVFRIVQEALNNVAEHAGARSVSLRLSLKQDSLVLRLRDDGRGFSPKAGKANKRDRRGFGLTNMQERALSMGGSCVIESSVGKGTTVTVRLPCRAPG